MIEKMFLSVGAMKAGTTWLYGQMRDHPEIYFTPEKEIHYFANQVGIEKQLNHRARILKLKSVLSQYAKGNPKFISQGLDELLWYSKFAHPARISNSWYEELFTSAPDEHYCADFSNLYCQMGKNGWDNVRQVVRKPKVIYTLRDPFKRLWSHYKFHMKWVGQEDKALDNGFENFKILLEKPWFWVNAQYAENYELLSKNLRTDELMLLYFEDFRSRPDHMLEEVQVFLGIEKIKPKQEDLNKIVNKTKDFDLPDEWADHMVKSLKPLCVKMKDSGLWHEDWLDLY